MKPDSADAMLSGVKRRLLLWYWALLAAPIALVSALALPEIRYGPNIVVKMIPEVFFQAVVIALFAVSASTLVVTLALFRKITVWFAPSARDRWPLYAATIALGIGALFSWFLVDFSFSVLEESDSTALAARRTHHALPFPPPRFAERRWRWGFALGESLRERRHILALAYGRLDCSDGLRRTVSEGDHFHLRR